MTEALGDPAKRWAGTTRYAPQACQGGSLGHPVTPPVASKARGFAPALSKPLPPRKKRPFRKREDGLSFRFPAKGLSVCYPSLADGQGCLRSASNQKPEKKGKDHDARNRTKPHPLFQISPWTGCFHAGGAGSLQPSPPARLPVSPCAGRLEQCPADVEGGLGARACP